MGSSIPSSYKNSNNFYVDKKIIFSLIFRKFFIISHHSLSLSWVIVAAHIYFLLLFLYQNQSLSLDKKAVIE